LIQAKNYEIKRKFVDVGRIGLDWAQRYNVI